MAPIVLHESEEWGDGYNGNSFGDGFGGRENSCGDGTYSGLGNGNGFGGAVDDDADIGDNEEMK